MRIYSLFGRCGYTTASQSSCDGVGAKLAAIIPLRSQIFICSVPAFHVHQFSFFAFFRPTHTLPIDFKTQYPGNRNRANGAKTSTDNTHTQAPCTSSTIHIFLRNDKNFEWCIFFFVVTIKNTSFYYLHRLFARVSLMSLFILSCRRFPTFCLSPGIVFLHKSECFWEIKHD